MLFKACTGFNLVLVRELLSGGKLSANVTNEERTSLLHVVFYCFSIIFLGLQQRRSLNRPIFARKWRHCELPGLCGLDTTSRCYPGKATLYLLSSSSSRCRPNNTNDAKSNAYGPSARCTNFASDSDGFADKRG